MGTEVGGSGIDGRTWVVGHDGSENSRHAALWAARHVAGRAERLQLVTAWHVPADTYLPAPGPYLSSLPDDLEAAAQHSVDELAESIGPLSGVDVSATVTFGGAARSLIESAPGVDLVVVGSRGRGGFARLLLGSTSTQVATHARTPTVVVPVDARVDAATRILVAVDGSENSLAAFDWALEFAASGCRIDSVHVRDGHHPDPRLGTTGGDLEPEAQLAQLLLERSAEHRDDLEHEHHVVEGPVQAELRERSERCDLLVMGARGHGAIGSAILGSVSTWLLHHLPVPMVVVPAPGEDGE